MFPQFNTTATSTNTLTGERSLGRVFLFDFDTKQHVLIDGKPVEATYEQAIQQWIKTLILTEAGKYRVYDDSGFGLSLYQFISRRDIPIGVINSEVKRQIEEQVLKHPEISSIQNFSTTRNNGMITISCNVVTKNGVMNSEVNLSG
ncbi:DUF2634 domain-containing protein [Paenibacillus sp. Root444D2]|uniref:DUF2634 domain-containing protein n=1 Tax=Paenibacillus sp. Root444D2 TaxID=1736538 RepID=UPI000709D1ED|nr:DUF2634 domain-containing protein [Paenibacillus sp. Root444D2]KQX69223.1 hypothetical protein ASD40_01615 [Paenibacillus sp. Root444D2]